MQDSVQLPSKIYSTFDRNSVTGDNGLGGAVFAESSLLTAYNSII